MLDKLNQEEFKRCGLAVVNFEPATSADFIFISFLAESLKNGRSVVYVSATQNLDSFRIAVNKMSIRFDTKNLQFVELGKLLSSNLSESTGTKLLEEIDKLFTAGQQKNLLVVLDNIHLICEDDLNDEISLLLGIQKAHH
ncbi:hypothetical protein M3Y97_00249900 [Aphelenchoides bicaudatus]|nr:hypothetical protein M3Y97_00249900 [Aphelenchoides bicaudatus]